MTSPDFDPSLAQGAHVQPGDLVTRFFARLIDGVLVGIVAFFLSFFLFDAEYQILVTGLFTGLLTFGYFVFFEVNYGTTPGKKLLGLAVHGPNGAAKPDFRQSAIRNSFTLLAVVPYYLGSLLALIAEVVIAVTINASPSKQGKHDELAGGTQVVKS
jgi:uncharacterized RDD family membrane protein YckC